MTSRQRRDKEAERAALRAAADRLLIGTPLYSASGKLTASELLRESGLRRDAAYGDHKDLIEEFQARARAQHGTTAALQKLAAENATLKARLAGATAELAKDRAVIATLRRIIAELDLELTQALKELAPFEKVTRLPAPRRRAARQ